jgi:iron complex transport system substrate-binding protein
MDRVVQRSHRLGVPEIENDLTRREFLFGAGLVVLAPGCGGEGESSESSGDTRIIEHRYGKTEVPADAARIVTIGLTDQDAVYALGKRPVACTDWLQKKVVFPWAEEAAGGETPEVLPFELNAEAVAAQEPDLVVGIFSDIGEEEYEKLSEVAPTIAGAAGFPPYETPWQEQTRMVGRALGKEGMAEELVAGVNRKLSAVAARHPEWEGASAVLASYYDSGQLYVYPAGNSGAYLLESLGFVIPGEISRFVVDPNQIPALSAERFDLIDVDLILWDSDHESLEASGILDVATFENLDAVREGRMVIPGKSLAAAQSFRTVLSLPWALERLEPQIVAAIDGDPETEVTR